jgi:hypothetical protein
VLVAADGKRKSLGAVAELTARQLKPGDELIVDVNDSGGWGHPARNRMAPHAKSGNLLWFLDDDDLPFDGALDTIRRVVGDSDDVAHVFRMRYHGGELWRTPEVLRGNVSTQMIVVPRAIATFVKWGDRYEGDLDFIRAVEAKFGPLEWHDDVICKHNGLRRY